MSAFVNRPLPSSSRCHRHGNGLGCVRLAVLTMKRAMRPGAPTLVERTALVIGERPQGLEHPSEPRTETLLPGVDELLSLTAEAAKLSLTWIVGGRCSQDRRAKPIGKHASVGSRSQVKVDIRVKHSDAAGHPCESSGGPLRRGASRGSRGRRPRERAGIIAVAQPWPVRSPWP